MTKQITTLGKRINIQSCYSIVQSSVEIYKIHTKKQETVTQTQDEKLVKEIAFEGTEWNT